MFILLRKRMERNDYFILITTDTIVMDILVLNFWQFEIHLAVFKF